ncbi:hypothetical protein SASPL_133196 [Salvia splendens]|uniref:Uncharacterized protein n=1 Tax=Salvia splendens TaxID=180675 RepID=A0A8X8X4F7_SALSN|nr:hypothetical protein SASPL_133196 [Salvia splendens]
MGDHFVLLVDRLLTESTLEAAIESRLKHVVPITVDEAAIDYSYQKDSEASLSLRKVCHFVLQQFKPGYTAPPPIFRLGGLPMNLRGNWQIARRDLNNQRIIAMVAADHSLLDPEYDEYAASTSRSEA